MDLTLGTNTYTTVAWADDYFLTARLFPEEWDLLDAGEKAAALLMACQYMERIHWLGERTDPLQALAWPRTGVVLDGRHVDSTSVPEGIQAVQCELALWLAGRPEDLDGLDEARMAEFSVKRGKGTQLPLYLRGLLAKWTKTRSANVVPVERA